MATDLFQKTVPCTDDGMGQDSTTTLFLTQAGNNFYVRTRFWTIKRFRSQDKAEQYFNKIWDLRKVQV